MLLAFVKNEEKSEGMLIEIGYALGTGKPFALAIKKGTKTTYLTEIAKPIIFFEDIDDLCSQLEHFT